MDFAGNKKAMMTSAVLLQLVAVLGVYRDQLQTLGHTRKLKGNAWVSQREASRLLRGCPGMKGAGYLGNLAPAKSLWPLNASLWSSPMAV